MKAILHMGMPKTGSSSIQDSIWQRKGRDFYYLDWTIASHNPLLMLLFEDGPFAAKQPEARDEWRARTTATLASKPADTVIFSAERLFNVNREVKERARDFFAAHCNEIQVVGYLRPPVSFLQSAFQQNLKTGPANLRLGQSWPHYQRKIQDMDDLFGRDNVTLRKFDRASLQDGDVVRDFCQLVGMPIDEEQIARSNESMSLEAAALLFMYRRLTGGDQGMSQNRHERDFVAKLSSIKGGKLRFSEELVGPVLERFGADVDWIEERLGQPLRDAGVPEGEGIVRNEADLVRMATANIDSIKDLIAQSAHEIGSRRTDVETALRVMRSFFP
jgi:hypothetical protein